MMCWAARVTVCRRNSSYGGPADSDIAADRAGVLTAHRLCREPEQEPSCRRVHLFVGPWPSSWLPETGMVMNDDSSGQALRVRRLMDTLALALLDMEPVLGPVDRQDLRELVMVLGWWSGRLAVWVDAQNVAATGGSLR